MNRVSETQSLLKVVLTVSLLGFVSLSQTAIAKNKSNDKDTSAKLPTIVEKTKDAVKTAGYFTYYYNAKDGHIWLEIDSLNQEFLYVSSLRTGLGSNPVGLDRGQLGAERVVKFVRFGPKILLLQPNLDYRADTDNPAEKRAVAESFAQSALWGGDIIAEDAGAVLVDVSDLLLRDEHDVIGRLLASGQGSFSLDKARSAIDSSTCRAFPQNTEFESILTFQSSKPGPLVRETTPTPKSVTLRQHHSLIELPDNNYKTRKFDPRAGVFNIDYLNFAASLAEPLNKRLIVRHRLSKKNPGATLSEPVKPIIYYVDPGAPEPVRSALIEGASWWAQAFEAAGFTNAFRVEVLPDSADPLDVRYNVIQWVHRSTRGWSYGGSVVDPRTGEIIKGHVSLGSLRVRQDRMIIEGLAPLFGAESFGRCEIGQSPAPSIYAEADPATDAITVALARIRQLGAHEVGHTLGLAHNFAASAYGRESVMDYPAPLAKIVGDTALDLSDAYATGIGEWDKIAIRYAYTEFPAGVNEDSALNEIINESIDRKLLFITDADARAPGSAHPLASLWDNGADPVEELPRMMRVRQIALNQFGEHNIRAGEPLSELRKALAPLYLSHRYQITATAKSLGGVIYAYKVRGDSQPEQHPVAPQKQRQALDALLQTITPDALLIPQRIVDLLEPQAYGYGDSRELLPSNLQRIFDPLSAAEVAARMTISAILQPERAGRMEEQHRVDTRSPSFKEALNLLVTQVWSKRYQSNEQEQAIMRVVQNVLVTELIRLAGVEGNISDDVRALATGQLRELEQELQTSSRRDADVSRAHRDLLWDTIQRFLSRPQKPAADTKPLSAPPGSPIGAHE